MGHKRADMLVHQVHPYNAEPPRVALAAGLLTPTSAFYVRNHGPVPTVDPARWRLRVDGRVQRPALLSLADLSRRFGVHEMAATLQCAGNRRAEFLAVRDIPGEHPWRSGAVSTATWTGVRLADVLAEAGVRGGAAHVEFRGADRVAGRGAATGTTLSFAGSIPLAKAVAGEVLLAWAMNGDPLPAAHGAPLRVVVPGYIGARSVKWLDRVTVSAHPSDSYFQTTAYRLPPTERPGSTGPGVQLGPLPLTCDVLQPDDGAVLPAGLITVSGYALTGHRTAVAAVEVSTDDGRQWVRATLAAPPHRWAWQRWQVELELASGARTILARAVDTAGRGQPATAASLWNPRGYLNHAWAKVGVQVVAAGQPTR